MINKQYHYEYAYGLFGNVADDGSGAIAITNICQLDHMNIDLEDILEVINHTFHPRLLGGLMGTNPFAIKRILKKCGFKVKFRGFLLNKMDLSKDRYFIVLYIWKDWLEINAKYQAGIVNKNGIIHLFNPYHRYSSPKQMKQFEEMICPMIFGIN